MGKCCICGATFYGKGLESQGLVLPVCGKPCFDSKVEEISKMLEEGNVQEPFHEHEVPMQGLMPAYVLA